MLRRGDRREVGGCNVDRAAHNLATGDCHAGIGVFHAIGRTADLTANKQLFNDQDGQQPKLDAVSLTASAAASARGPASAAVASRPAIACTRA